MVSIDYPKVLYDVSPDDFRVPDADHTTYEMSSRVQIGVSPVQQSLTYLIALVTDTGLIVQQFSLVILFAILFVHIDQNVLEPKTILSTNSCIGIIGLFIYRRHAGLDLFKQNVKTLIIFILFGSLVSPVLFTLTKTISTDTIYAMSTLMMLSHLIFFDYGSDTAMVQKAFSFSVALFASVCLASRLSTSLHTFCLVTSAVLVFALWPEIRKYLKASCSYIFHTLTLVHVVTCIAFLSKLSVVHTILYSLAIMFLTLICPLWFIQLQRFKISMHGAWEEAVVLEHGKDKMD